MITDKQIIAEVSVLFSDSRKRNWSPGPPPLPPPPVSISALRETSASGKLRTSVASHLQSKPSRECLVCRVCVWCGFVFTVHHSARKSLTILSGGSSIKLRTPGSRRYLEGVGQFCLFSCSWDYMILSLA